MSRRAAPPAPPVPPLARAAVLLLVGVAAIAGAKGRFRALDDALWDRLQRKLPARTPALPLALAGIGEASVEAVGGFPFPRSTYARILDALMGAGARRVALDVFFEGDGDPAQDRALGEAVRRHRALLPFHAGEVTRLGPDGAPETRFVTAYPPEGIRRGAGGLGFANLPVEENPDDVYRRLWFARAPPAGDPLPGLGVAIARAHGQADLPDPPEGLVRLDLRALRAGDAVARIEVADVLAGDPAALAQVKDRLVIVGATAPRLGDIKTTSLGAVPGALLHAAVAENMAGGRWVRELPGPAGLLLALPALGGAAVASARLWPLLGFATAAGSTLLVALLALLGFWLPPGAPVGAGIALLLGGGLALLAPSSRREAAITDPEKAVALLRAALAEGDALATRRTFARCAPPAREDDTVRVLYARALVPAGMEGALARVLAEARRGASASLEDRLDLVASLEEAGMLEFALEELEELYDLHPGEARVGDALFRLREERDRRFGVLSPRQVRDLLGREYRDLRGLGEGAEGLAFAGEDREDGTPVVLKVLHPRALEDAGALARFRRECEALSEIAGPGLPELLRVSKGRLPYLAMRREPGAEWDPAAAGGPAPREVLARLVHALERLHAAGWVHRDVKPENLVVAPGGEALLIDFGLAARIGETTEAGGTPGYAAPEQLAGEPADPAQDIHALGRLALRVLPEDDPLRELAQGAVAAEPGARPGVDAWARALDA